MMQPLTEVHEPVDDGRMRTAEQARDLTRGFLLVAAPEGGSGVDAVLVVVSEPVADAVLDAGGVTGFQLGAGAGTVTVRTGRCPSTKPRSGIAGPGTTAS
ncbi:hypothetical protein [Streptomyces sp. NL15-2K]|uniref:hypothetical protein n=1 Tax=Streptomyces sp. NL15-2K TaxID=376149 RepID=UPI000F58652C|nr:hypothetical protein [Kutzneria buriramensis]WKX15848.1 hypothetical protein Q4V64_53515 [Kutzneria buriramensis]